MPRLHRRIRRVAKPMGFDKKHRAGGGRFDSLFSPLEWVLLRCDSSAWASFLVKLQPPFRFGLLRIVNSRHDRE